MAPLHALAGDSDGAIDISCLGQNVRHWILEPGLQPDHGHTMSRDGCLLPVWGELRNVAIGARKWMGWVMQPDDLSVKERAVLLALLGEAREISNPELAERAGFRLDGKERRKLNDLKLVESRKVGRAYAHELTDAGWHWCATELTAEPRGKVTSMEGALYAILGGLARHLEDTGQSLADLFRPRPAQESEPPVAAPRDGDITGLIETAYHGLADAPGKFVKISELRTQLSGISRADLNSALEGMYRSQRVNLVPQSNQQALTDADRQAALRIGGEDKHLILVRQP
jgi:hypothetical protein